jgi:hypothetical protein
MGLCCFVMQGEKRSVDLIISVGCKADDKQVPEAGKALRLKTINDAWKLRNSVGPPI